MNDFCQVWQKTKKLLKGMLLLRPDGEFGLSDDDIRLFIKGQKPKSNNIPF
jgi:hypothetical protein